MGFYENRGFTSTLKKYNHIMIFGAKKNAHDAYALIKEKGFDIDCFIVSERSDNPFFLDERPVRTFDEIDTARRSNVLVIISQIYEKNDEMEDLLFQAGFKNTISGPYQIMPLWKKDGI